MRTTQLTSITEDFLKTALTNDFTYICVYDKELYNKYRARGIRQIRAFKGALALACDTLGNVTIVTPEGTVLQS